MINSIFIYLLAYSKIKGFLTGWVNSRDKKASPIKWWGKTWSETCHRTQNYSVLKFKIAYFYRKIDAVISVQLRFRFLFAKIQIYYQRKWIKMSQIKILCKSTSCYTPFALDQYRNIYIIEIKVFLFLWVECHSFNNVINVLSQIKDNLIHIVFFLICIIFHYLEDFSVLGEYFNSHIAIEQVNTHENRVFGVLKTLSQ